MLGRPIISVISVLLLLAASVAAETVKERFAAANQAYEAQNYDSAIVLYQSILDQGVESAPLYFNLGNACFRNGDLGHAVLYYERAQRLDPSDPDVAGNLEFAARYTSIQMEGVELNPISSLLESIVEPYRLNAWAWIASVCFLLLFVVLIVRYGLGFRGTSVRAGVIVMLILTLATAALTTIKYETEYLTKRAVIVAENSVVHSGPSERSPKELDAAPGLVVEVLDETGDYYNVLFENKRRGWIRKDLVAVI